MQLTNKANLPLPLVRAIENDSYDAGDSDFTATSLLRPPRVSALMKKHHVDISVDVLDRLFALYGQIGHSLLERAGHQLPQFKTEKRLFGLVDNSKISAQIDSLSLEEDGTLIDWKFTTVYGFMKGETPKVDWVMQMNIQLEMLRQNGLRDLVKQMRIYGLLRDWRPKEARMNKNYPEQVSFHEIKMLESNQIQEFIKTRIQKHRQAETELPQCSDFDHWSWRRCAQYCDVNRFCSQWKNHKGE